MCFAELLHIQIELFLPIVMRKSAAIEWTTHTHQHMMRRTYTVPSTRYNFDNISIYRSTDGKKNKPPHTDYDHKVVHMIVSNNTIYVYF